jgi:hypothetical protein
LQALTALQELWLGRNRISVVAHLGCLGRLRRLSLQSNRLDSMAGLGGCTALEELYLSHNGIWALDPCLAQLTGLRVSGVLCDARVCVRVRLRVRAQVLVGRCVIGMRCMPCAHTDASTHMFRRCVCLPRCPATNPTHTHRCWT